MDRGARIFESLRRQRRGFGRVAWLWFALASAASGAAPCAVMAAPGASGHEHATAIAAHVEHSHARAHDESHADQKHFDGHAHADGQVGDHARADEPPAAHEPAAGADQDDTHEPRSACPHCPPAAMAADGSTSSHARCSVADDASDAGKPSAHTPAAKTVAAVPVIELLPVDAGPRFAHGAPRPPDDGIASVPLNLRHCVFLI